MTAGQHSNDVEIQQLEPQPILSIRATVQIVDLAQAQDDRLRALSSYLQQSGAQLASPPFVRYHTLWGKVMTSLSMSLDGFVAEPNDDVQQVFAWMDDERRQRYSSPGRQDGA